MSFHLVSGPSGLRMGKGKALMSIHSMKWHILSLRAGKISQLSTCARNPEVSKGRKLGSWEAPAWAPPGLGPPCLLVTPERRAVLGEAGMAPLAPGLTGQDIWPSGHLPLGLWTWFKGRLPKGRKPKWKHLHAWQRAPNSPSTVVGWVISSHISWAAWHRQFLVRH